MQTTALSREQIEALLDSEQISLSHAAKLSGKSYVTLKKYLTIIDVPGADKSIYIKDYLLFLKDHETANNHEHNAH